MKYALVLIGGVLAVAMSGCKGNPPTSGGPADSLVVNVVFPTDGVVVRGPTALQVNVTGSSGGTKVRFIIDGLSVSTDSTAPWEYTWDPTALPNGSSHTFQAIATDVGGNADTSALRTMFANYAPGEIWTLRSSGGLYDLRDIATDGAVLVAVGDSGRIITSDSGINWTLRASPTKGHLNGVASTSAYGFVAVCSLAGGDTILFSPTGTTWTARTTTSTTGNLNDIMGFSATLMAVGCNGQVFRSTNGISWSLLVSGGPCVEAIKWCGLANAQYVVVGQDGKIYTSNNGSAWDARNSGTVNWLRDVVGGCSKIVAVGDGGTIRSSTDGISWTSVASLGVDLNAVACSADAFVAVGKGGAIYTSFDAGATWTARTSPTTNDLHGITVIGSRYVAVGVDGTIITSP